MPYEKIIEGDLLEGAGVEGRREKRRTAPAGEKVGPEKPVETPEPRKPRKKPPSGRPWFADGSEADIFHSKQT